MRPLGDFDGFVSKFDADGIAEWTRLFGTTAEDGYAPSGVSVSLDASGAAYAAASTEGSPEGWENQGGYDGFVTRFNSAGEEEAIAGFGTPLADNVYGMASSPDGAVYVVGDTTGALGAANAGQTDLFVVSLSL